MTKRPRPKPKTPVPNYLREWREHLGLTQEQLAARMGVQPPTVSRYENGEVRLSLDTLAAAAEAMGVPPLVLYRRPSDPSIDAMLTGLTEDERRIAVATMQGMLAGILRK